jgi:hypothetical protein
MIFGKCETASLFNYSRLTLLLIIFHLISSDQTANANNNSGTYLADKDQLIEPIQISFTTVSTNCHNSSDGSIDIYITGGVEPYSYLWSDGSIAEDLLLVKAGIYSVQVTDANGVSQTGTVEIEAPQEFTVKSEVANSIEKSPTGFINVELAGGTAPYTYSWSNGENKSLLTNLNAGVYSLTYTDVNGCSGFFNTEIHLLSDFTSKTKIEEENSISKN